MRRVRFGCCVIRIAERFRRCFIFLKIGLAFREIFRAGVSVTVARFTAAIAVVAITNRLLDLTPNFTILQHQTTGLWIDHFFCRGHG